MFFSTTRLRKNLILQLVTLQMAIESQDDPWLFSSSSLAFSAKYPLSSFNSRSFAEIEAFSKSEGFFNFFNSSMSMDRLDANSSICAIEKSEYLEYIQNSFGANTNGENRRVVILSYEKVRDYRNSP